MYTSISYIPETNTVHIFDDKKGYRDISYRKYGYYLDEYGTHRTMFGQMVSRMTTWDKNNKYDPSYFETDVNPELRTLIDLYYNDDDVSTGHRDIIIDIEVDSTKGFPTITLADNEITAISLYSCQDDIYFAILLDKDGLIVSEEKDNIYTISCKTEVELLDWFFAVWKELTPTTVTGWHIQYFDIPYLYKRSCRLRGIEAANQLSPLGIVREVVDRETGVITYKIVGIAQLDYLRLYKKYSYKEQPSYTLDYIGKAEVGVGKVKFDMSLDTLYKTDITKFLEYNLNDVRIVKLINDKYQYLDLVRMICHFCHIPYEDIWMQSRALEAAILSELKKDGIVAPNKPTSTGDRERIAGAFVKESDIGLFKWVYDVDATSLYPSIIISLNISPETKFAKISNWDNDAFIEGREMTYYVTLVEDGMVISITNLREYLKNNNLSVSANGILYKLNKEGIIPHILKKWFKQRQEYNSLAKEARMKGDDKTFHYYDKRQLVMKILLNSMYGALLLPSFRFFDKDNGLAVTSTGQQISKYAAKTANDYYNEKIGGDSHYNVAGDTDSIFMIALPLIAVLFPDYDEDNIEQMVGYTQKVCDIIQNLINKSMETYADKYHNVKVHMFSFKQELICSSALFLAKKHYALKVVNEKGVNVNEYRMKGLETIKSNYADIFRSFLSNVIYEILDGADRDRINKLSEEFRSNIGEVDYLLIGKPTGVKEVSKYITDSIFRMKKGTPVHVKAALCYNFMLSYYKYDKLFSPIVDNSKIKWFYLKPNPFNLTVLALRGYEDPPELSDFVREYVDKNKMIEADLKNKIDGIYDALKWYKQANNTFSLFFSYD